MNITSTALLLSSVAGIINSIVIYYINKKHRENAKKLEEFMLITRDFMLATKDGFNNLLVENEMD